MEDNVIRVGDLSEEDLRKEVYQLEAACAEARDRMDFAQLGELMALREGLLDRLEALLPEGEELGFQHNPDARVDKMDIDQVPVPIVGDGGLP